MPFKMKILFFCDEYPPAKTGGIGSTTKIIAENLVGRGHNIFIAGNIESSSLLPEYSEINGVNIYRKKCLSYLKYTPKKLEKFVNFGLRKTGVLSKISHNAIIKTENFISELIISEKIDLIEIVDYTLLIKNLKKKVVLIKYSIPTVMRIHGSKSFIEFHQGKTNKLSLANDISNFNRADFYCAVSKYSASFVIKNLGIEKDKIKVIYNPLEESFFTTGKMNVKTKNTILFIGKITETKGAFSLLKAFNEVSKKNPSIKLVLIGDGNIEFAKSLIANDARNKVIFKGYVDRKTIMNEIDRCKLAVVPSYFENFGMVAIEIMARGKALIFTDRASGPELIENKIDGILVDPENINLISESILLLLGNNNLRNKLEVNGYRKIKENFSEKVIINELEKYYKSIINQNIINKS